MFQNTLVIVILEIFVRKKCFEALATLNTHVYLLTLGDYIEGSTIVHVIQ